MGGWLGAKRKTLREQLFELIDERDRLVALCRARQKEIVAEWPAWIQELVRLQTWPEQAQVYAQSLRAIAEVFQKELDDPRLLKVFAAGPEVSLDFATEGLTQARQQVQQLQLDAARLTLLNVLKRLEKLESDEAQHLLTIIHGDLAQAAFFAGDCEEAAPHLQKALTLSRKQGDEEGVATYSRSWYELLRYADRRAEARQFAEGMAAETHEDFWVLQAAQEHEPLLRPQVQIGDRLYEGDKLPPFQDGTFRVTLARNRITLYPAQRLCREGRQLAEAGHVSEAATCFLKAAQADRYDPESRLLLGCLLLDTRRAGEAIPILEECERLAPGYLHVRSDLWFAREMAAGRLHQQAWPLWRQLEDAQLQPAARLERAQALLDLPRAPVAGAYFHRGRALEELNRNAEAEDAYRKALANQPEPHLSGRVCLQLGGLLNNPELLREAAAGQNLASATMARWLLSS